MTEHLFSLKEKTVLLTGATGHLGQAMAQALGAAGAHVYLNARSAESCELAAAALRKAGLMATAASFDITKEDQIDAFFSSLGNKPLHVLINNAYAGGGGSIATSSPQSYRESYEVSVISAQQLLSKALPNLRAAVVESGDASVINIASMYGLVSPDLRNYPSAQTANPPFYGAAKAALVQFTRYAACEFGKDGIRVNAIAPGPFPSPIVMNTAPDFVEILAKKVPMNRVGSAAEMAGPVVFLASRAASFVNGAILSVDGGWTSW